ncbi:hypothetical protein XA68_16097 [Ophiocordyceps unilateralis]|uniref:Peptidase A1 domain-containing protein n=1 Tax=Ophiocordyceps unilateralis TaxID=268505 RepID=A0A2A9P6V5_OPHUN|nr:hypothetical protein XA68_16097 [Ophiocordyceps unilateralis]
MLFLLALAAAAVSAGHISIPLQRRVESSSPSPDHLLRRSGSISLDALNNLTGGGFYAEFAVGTPPQSLSFLLDTGSSDTWVNSVDAGLCHDAQQQNSLGAWCLRQFDPRASSSFRIVDRGGFNISYLDQKHVSGDYFTDTLTIGGQTIRNQQLGLALDSTRPTGIMGLGFSANVAAPAPYPVVVDNMLSQGLINAPAFSLYLNDLDAKSGTILFGAIDTQKYYNRLVTLPILSNPASASNATAFTVRLRAFSAGGIKLGGGGGGGGGGDQVSAVLDSGSTISLLPPALVQSLNRRFQVVSAQGFPAPLVDCAYRDPNQDAVSSFDFEFDGITIRVPVKEMIIDAFGDETQQAFRSPAVASLFAGWRSVCVFGIGSTADYGIATDRFALLGDTFIRSAYILYDLANRQIGIAQAKTDSTKSNIVEIAKDAKQIPSDAGAAKDSAAVPGSAPAVVSILVAIAALVLL